ncbi:MAG: ATP-binding protein [Arcobacteraceae bacterium]|nr:ATP-binding protein [Arcobacteraceae bacterium]
MQTFTTIYKNDLELLKFIDENSISSHGGEILVQIFNSNHKIQFIKQLQSIITTKLPRSKIIGTTTCGEISNEGMIEHSCVISFSLFDKTIIHTIIKSEITHPFMVGQDIAKELCLKSNLKCAIAFSDGLTFNSDDVLKGINSIDSNIILCGGLSGDNSKFKNSYIFTNDIITSSGFVVAGLYSENLHIYTDYNFNWLSIGKTHTITESKGNKVIKIDDMSAVEFYKYYLGEDIEEFLPKIGIEFPLIIQDEELPRARAVLQKYDNGVLGFAGSIKTGTQIKFGYGDIEMILNHSKDMAIKINNHIPIESIFIYSCMARKSLLKKDINMEILPLKNIANISGFFTYGEFFNYKNTNYLLNETMTILTLSESSTPKLRKTIPAINQIKLTNPDFIRKKALSNLIAQTSKELEILQRDLKAQVQIELEKSLEKDHLIKLNSRHALLGEMIEMILHQWRQPLSTFALATSTLQLFKETKQLTDALFEKHTDIMMNNVYFLNETITVFREFFNTEKIQKKTKASAIMHKVFILLAPIVKQYSDLIDLSIENDEWFFLDENELIHVILNIIKNSIDEFDKNKINTPNIHIKFSSTKEHLFLEIEDNGGGIDENIINKIFDKKFTTKTHAGGTGLGLNMSKNIIENNLHGEIKALNGAYGAIFKIKVPIK